jgi:hypothetical protein
MALPSAPDQLSEKAETQIYEKSNDPLHTLLLVVLSISSAFAASPRIPLKDFFDNPK